MLLLIVLTLLFGYLARVFIKIGLHQRLPLVLGPVSLEKIPDRAAKQYGNKIIFTITEPIWCNEWRTGCYIEEESF